VPGLAAGHLVCETLGENRRKRALHVAILTLSDQERQRAMKARIKITLKNGVLDPQGKAIQNALGSLGFSGVEDVRQGKYIEVKLAEADEAKAREQVERMCKDLLANTVIENYSYEITA
jgi:phosphoribosylformylglycinamidine synthase PurS subunit